jgi:demethylmenaquinone methyltransferase/2-methoxy-6-polyprenyl-1,4-benzoquinol methylase
MPEQSSMDKLTQQRDLFSRIADQYDLVNHFITGWQDIRWRKYAVQQLKLPPSGKVLDIGSGNGQIVQETLLQYPDCIPVAVDLTQKMIRVGKNSGPKKITKWSQVDSAYLPFSEDHFDGVISGFLIRNLKNTFKGLQEQYRVLKPGGRISVLETTRPPQHIISPLIQVYMKKIMPFLGGLLTGHKDAYTYLSSSTQTFLRAEELTAYLAAVGFKKLAFRQFGLGIITVYWGIK